MTALDFPANPTVGQVFGRWTWDGTAWVLTGGGGVVPKPAGSTAPIPAGIALTGGFTTTPLSAGYDSDTSVIEISGNRINFKKAGLYMAGLNMAFNNTGPAVPNQLHIVGTLNGAIPIMEQLVPMQGAFFSLSATAMVLVGANAFIEFAWAAASNCESRSGNCWAHELFQS